MALALLVIEQIVFLTIAVVIWPTQQWWVILYAFWMLLPALSAAALASNGPLRGLGAILVTLVSVVLWICLIVVKGHLREIAGFIDGTWLAIIHAAFGLLAAVICAGFVEGILHHLDAHRSAGRRALVMAGLRKGMSFGALCAGIAALMMLLLGPSSTSGRRPEAVAAEKARRQNWVNMTVAVFVLGTLAGTAAGGVTGSQYRVEELSV